MNSVVSSSLLAELRHNIVLHRTHSVFIRKVYEHLYSFTKIVYVSTSKIILYVEIIETLKHITTLKIKWFSNTLVSGMRGQLAPRETA